MSPPPQAPPQGPPAGGASGTTNGQKPMDKNTSLLDLLRFSSAPKAHSPQTSVTSQPSQPQHQQQQVPHDGPDTSTGINNINGNNNLAGIRAAQQSPRPAAPMNPQDLVAQLFHKATSPPPLPKHLDDPAIERAGSYNRQPPISPPGDAAKSPVSPQALVHQILGRPKPDYDGAADNIVDESAPSLVPDVADESNSKPIRAAQPEQSLNIDDLRRILLSKAEQLGSKNLQQQQQQQSSSGGDSAVPSAPPSEAPSVVPPQVPQNSEVPTPPSAVSAKPVFTYVNPFEQLHATSPRNRTPKPKSPAPASLLAASSIPLPFSPDPEVMINRSFQAEKSTDVAIAPSQVEVQGDSSEAATGRHTPPVMQPYVEDVHDPFEEEEQDPLGQESDPFDGNDGGAVASDKENGNSAEVVTDTTKDEILDNNNESAKVLTSPPPAPAAETSEQAETNEPEPVQTGISNVTPIDGPDATAPVNVAVKVFKFPMMPYSLITICPSSDLSAIPPSRFSDIARMGRSADQLDRNLLSATSAVIVYAMGAKSKGGIRIIRQDDGKDGILLKDSPDRIVHVTIGKDNKVYATANSGAVYWIDLNDANDFDDAVL